MEAAAEILQFICHVVRARRKRQRDCAEDEWRDHLGGNPGAPWSPSRGNAASQCQSIAVTHGRRLNMGCIVFSYAAELLRSIVRGRMTALARLMMMRPS